MALLFDDDAPEIPVVFDEHVLDLTFYEAGNVLWKANTLQGRLSTDEREAFSELLVDLRREVTVHTLEDIGLNDVMAVAVDAELTFYDAAYLACAEKLDATLVSEDADLRAVSGSISVERVRGID